MRALQRTINRGADNRRTGSHFNYLDTGRPHMLFAEDRCGERLGKHHRRAALRKAAAMV